MSDNRYQIRVDVQSRFLPEQSDPDADRFGFAYTVRITNSGTVAAQLISRHWLIQDDSGRVIEVKGLGVVGQQPLLNPGQTFEYTSGSQIGSATGTMQGSYFFVAEDGQRFDVEIARFTLSMPRTLH